MVVRKRFPHPSDLPLRHCSGKVGSSIIVFQRNRCNLPCLLTCSQRSRNVSLRFTVAIGSDPEGQRWTIPVPFPVDDPEYRRVIYEQIEQCHEGLSQEVYQKIYEASLFRDEGMASVITATVKLDTPEPTTFVSYTGAGHIQYGLPVPKRVKRQLGVPVKDVTVYLHALDPEHPEDVDHLIDERIADYVWLTALGPQGRQPRCGA